MNRNRITLACLLALGTLAVPSRSDVPPSVVEAGKAATALVEAGDGSGTAFCIAPTGYFVTNEHVVSGETAVKLVLHPGEKAQKVVTARVVRTDKDEDLALLKEDDPQPVTALTLGRSVDLREALSVTAFGFPFGAGLAEGKEEYPSISVSTGHVTALRREGGVLRDVQLDASLNPGNSGGPVLNDAGQVIGVVASGIPGAALNFAIPVDSLKPLLAQPIVTFQPPLMSEADAGHPIVFHVGVSSPLGNSATYGVTLSLTGGGHVLHVATATPTAPGIYTALLTPVPARAGAHPAPPDMGYRVAVTQAGKVVGEASGTFHIVAAPSTGGAAKAPTVVLPPIHPASLADDKTLLPLPAVADDVVIAGGGRYLVLSLKSLDQLAIFDVNAGRIVHFLPMNSDSYHFAAGAHSLVIVLDDKKTIERWSLDTFARELVTAEPNWSAVRDMRMGYASEGPAFVEMTDGSTKWLDVKTLTPMKPPMENAPLNGGSNPYPVTFRVSPDGGTVLTWLTQMEPHEVTVTSIRGGHADTHTRWYEGFGGDWIPGRNGDLIFTNNGVETANLDAIKPDELSKYHCLPAEGGGLFLAVSGPSVAIYSAEDQRLLLTLPDLEELKGDYWDMERQIFLIPAANLLVTLPSARNQLVLRRFDLVAAMNKVGIDYLFVNSVPPPAFHAGRRYVYVLDVKSKRGGVIYSLDSGPTGMTLDKTGKLVWVVPAGYAGSEEYVVVRLKDASGQEIYHTFRIEAQ